MYYLIKSPSETDASITIQHHIENKFAICTADTAPTQYDFYVEFGEPFHSNMYLYDFSNGKRHKTDIFMGKVEMIQAEPGRLVINYSADQVAARLELHRWFALNVFVVDQDRLTPMPDTAKNVLIDEINAINNDETLRAFIIDNLYYDL